MKIIIIGAGLLGVTTAYELGKRGHQVTVLERKPECAADTSFANGGQLSYNHAEPWANPSVLTKLPKWMLRDDAPLVMRPRADWPMIRWGLQFLRNCTNERAQINCVNLLRLGLYSREKMAQIMAETGISFHYNDRGILHIYSTQKDFDAAQRQNEFQAKFGGLEETLTREQVYQLEPAFIHSPREIVGGIHAHADASGDARSFCQELAKVAEERHKVKFIYNIKVDKLKEESGSITAVSTDQGDMHADEYIIAAGSYSAVLLRDIGIDVPIYPMKGYSISINANEFCPDMSLTDGTHKIVYSRLGSTLRVAGTAEFAGYDHSINEKRIIPIVKAASALFPKADWKQEIRSWACLRPQTPDGPPIIGKTRYLNLFLNTGHGTLGWTQAAGSAHLLSDMIDGKPPGIIMAGLTKERYN